MSGGHVETMIVIAKPPVPGRVKTRLVPPLTHEQAAELAAACLTDTLDAVHAVAAHRHVLAFDGPAGSWLRPGWRPRRQPAGGLDRRLGDAFLAYLDGAALLVGMDTPQLTPELLGEFDPRRYDACLGPCPDGGYWAIGFRHPAIAPRAILGVPMSRPNTGAEQLRRLESMGLRVQQLPELRDVDTIDDAQLVAADAPASRFATALSALELDAAQAR